MKSKDKFAISFSGGGFSSFAYAGFNDVLVENNLSPSHYAGLSGGALFAVLAGSEMHAEETKDIIQSIVTHQMLNLHISHFELVDHNKFIRLLRKLLPYKTFDKLPIPVTVLTTDLVQREVMPITTGDIASAVVASCSVFPMMQPIKRRGMLLGDGGFTAFYGAQFLRNKRTPKVVGLDVTGLTEGVVRGFLSALYKQINSSIGSNSRYELDKYPVDLDIGISFPAPSVFTVNKQAEHIIRLGRKSADENISKIRRILQIS